jgi:hypothetical protein
MSSPEHQDRIFTMLEKMSDKLSSLDSKIAVIQDQNRGQLRELEALKIGLNNFKCRCDKRHTELEHDRHAKHGGLGERLQRIETILWLIGSTLSLLALVLGGGVIVKFIGS